MMEIICLKRELKKLKKKIFNIIVILKIEGKKRNVG